VTIIVLRDDREVPIEVRPITIIEELVVVEDDYNPLQTFGVVLDDTNERQIVVHRVIPSSPAFRAGIREGDVITTFRGQRVTSPRQFVQVLERVEPGEIPVVVTRDQRTQEFQVDVPRFERRAVGQRRTTARPNIDRTGVERREDRREIRTERREDRREGAAPAQPAPPARPGILPRNR
jgi:predicted metalloprotease with PDZ domain